MKIVLILGAFVLFSFRLQAQNDSIAVKKSPELSFIFKKISDGSFELKSRLSLFEKRKDIPVAGAKVNFIIGTDSVIRIEGNLTDKNGYALAYIKPGVKIPKDKEGKINASAEFTGDRFYEAVTSPISFVETKIGITFDLLDSVKTVKLEAFKIGSDGTETPLSGEAVTVSVQRMFSRLPIGDVTIDEAGKGTIEFPSGLPGDSVGNLQIVAFIADHELYGNIETSSIIKWGVPKQQILVTHRALWTQIAPLWMIVSLTILLIGVWAHYMYVIFQLIIIKTKGKKVIVE